MPSAPHDVPAAPRARLADAAFAAAAVTLGLVGLAFGAFSPVWQPVPDAVPARQALVWVVMTALVVGGAATVVRRARRAGAALVGLACLLFAAGWVPRVVHYGAFVGLFEQLAPVCAAALLVARSARGVRAARVGVGLCALAFGAGHFTALGETGRMVPAWAPLGGAFWAAATGAAFVVAGAAIVSGVWAAPAARLLAAMLAGFAALVWGPAVAAQPTSHLPWSGAAVTLLAAAAAWVAAEHGPDEAADARRAAPRSELVPATPAGR